MKTQPLGLTLRESTATAVVDAAEQIAPREGVARATRPIECSGCGRCYDGERWPRLRLAGRLDARQVRCFVLGWPDEHFIEVRWCRCGRRIAVRRSKPDVATR